MLLEIFLGCVAFLLGCAILKLGLLWYLFWLVVSMLFDLLAFLGFFLSSVCSKFAQCIQRPSKLKEITTKDGCVLVTGASSGLGYEMSLEYLRKGFSVIGVGYSGRKVLEGMKNEHKAFDFVVADLSKEEGVQKVINKAKNVSILVNNAGIGWVGRFQNQINNESNKHDMIMSLNMRTYIRLTQAFLPDMIKKKTGRIFAMGSIVGYALGPNNAMYHATKAFVNNFFSSLWYDLQGTGVGVTLGAPGATATAYANKAGPSILWKLPGITYTAKDTARLMVAATLAGKKYEAGSRFWRYVTIFVKLSPEFFIAVLLGVFWSESIDIHSWQHDLDSHHNAVC